jgi:RimJ/RimL family protein N-acetyltransferase
MHLITLPKYRNRGFATALKQMSARSMAERRFTALYSRIWWTNEPSLRVSAKAGWQRVGTLLRVSLPLRRDPISIAWESRST